MRLPRWSWIIVLYACVVGCAEVAAFLGGAATGALADGALRKGGTTHEAPTTFWDVVNRIVGWPIAILAVWVVIKFRHVILGKIPVLHRAADKAVRAVVGKARSLE